MPLASPSEAPGRILLVDDDEALLRALSRALRRFGHVVETAHNGQIAASALETGAFDVLVSDVAMPGMNGIELLLAARRVDLDIPVVLITGTPDVAIAARAIELGALRYLTKPIDHDVLGKVVGQAVRLGRLARVKRRALELIGNIDEFVGDRAGLEVCFGKALETLWMAYQPIVTYAGKRIHAYEALVRNEEPTLVNPLALLSAAERLGRAHDLGRAIRKCVASAATSVDCKLFVNLHPLDFTDEDLFSTSAPLSQFASRVVLEITERESLDKLPDLESRITMLRAMGYQIAVDDLGAGYAGLTSLVRLQPDAVKLDLDLVRGVNDEPTKRLLVEMIVGVAREMEFAVVAEGVETAAERNTLVELGCDLMQGYLFARPGRPFPRVNWNDVPALVTS